jgi:hypothetical protein
MHSGATVTTVVAHLLGVPWLEDTLLGIAIALVLFGLYYRFVLVRAGDDRARRPSTNDGSRRRDSGN